MTTLITETQAAEMLDCEPCTVQEKLRNGELPGVKLGRSWRIPLTALMEALHAKAMANMATKPRKSPVAIVKPITARRPPALPRLS